MFSQVDMEIRLWMNINLLLLYVFLYSQIMIMYCSDLVEETAAMEVSSDIVNNIILTLLTGNGGNGKYFANNFKVNPLVNQVVTVGMEAMEVSGNIFVQLTKRLKHKQ